MKNIIREYKESFTSLSHQCQKLLLLYLIRSVSAGVVFYIAIYLAHINLKASVIGYEISALVFGNLFGALFCTNIIEKVNPVKLSAWSLALQGVCFVLVASSEMSYILACSVFFLGFFGYTFKISCEYVVTSVSGSDKTSRSKAISLLTIFSNVGLSLGGVLVSIFSLYSAKLMFFIVAIVLLISSVSFFKLENMDYKPKNNTDNRESNVVNNKIYYAAGLFSVFMMGLIFSQQRIAFGIFLDANYPGYGAGSLILLNLLLITFTLPLFRKYFMRGKLLINLGVGILMLGMGYFFLQFTTSYLQIISICFVWTAGEMIGVNLTHFLCFHYAEKKGRATAIYKLLYSIGTLIGAVGGSKILEYYDISILWNFCGLIGVAVFITLLIAHLIFVNKFNYQVLSKHSH